MASTCTEKVEYKYKVIDKKDKTIKKFDTLDDAMKFASKSDKDISHILETRTTTTIMKESYIAWKKSKETND